MQILIVCASLLALAVAYPGAVDYDISSYGSSGHDNVGGDIEDDDIHVGPNSNVAGKGVGPQSHLHSSQTHQRQQTKYVDSTVPTNTKYARVHQAGAGTGTVPEAYVERGTKYVERGTKYVEETAPVKYHGVPSYGNSGHASSYSDFTRVSHPIEVTKVDGSSSVPTHHRETTQHDDGQYDDDVEEDDGPVYEKKRERARDEYFGL